jgi:hypothetical protein
MAKERIPDSIKQPLSVRADYADPYLYGGAAAIVGIIGLIAGAAYALLGNWTVCGILSGLGAVLLVAGFLVARRRKPARS